MVTGNQALFNLESPFLYNVVRSLNEIHKDHSGKCLLFTSFIIYNYFRFHPNKALRKFNGLEKAGDVLLLMFPAAAITVLTSDDKPLVSFFKRDSHSGAIKSAVNNNFLTFNMNWLLCGLFIFTL